MQDLLKHGVFVAKDNPAKNASKAFDVIQLIFEKATEAEIFNYYYCPKCPKEKRVFFANILNGTGFINRHVKNHSKGEEENNKDNLFYEAENSNMSSGMNTQMEDATIDTEVAKPSKNVVEGCDIVAKTGDDSISTTIELTELANAFSVMMHIGQSSGRILEPSVIREMLSPIW